MSSSVFVGPLMLFASSSVPDSCFLSLSLCSLSGVIKVSLQMDSTTSSASTSRDGHHLKLSFIDDFVYSTKSNNISSYFFICLYLTASFLSSSFPCLQSIDFFFFFCDYSHWLRFKFSEVCYLRLL